MLTVQLSSLFKTYALMFLLHQFSEVHFEGTNHLNKC